MSAPTDGPSRCSRSLDVVIVTHNSAEHLPEALAALPPGVRVIVVDNASTDDSARLAADAGAEVVRGEVNAGFAAGANRGARLGDAEHILFLNPDAVIDGVNLDRLLAVMAAEPDTAVVSPRIRRPDGRDQRARWPFPTPTQAWREALGLGRVGRRPPAGAGFVIGACVLVRRATFEALHGFDERFWLYGEEADLCRRAIDAGWRVRLVDDAVADHVAGASGRGLEDLVFEHFNRGVEHLAVKHHGPGGLLSVRVAELVGSAIRSVAPGDPARRRSHRRRLRRLTGVLARTPLSVPLDSPATRAPGVGLVVCSLEAWDEVWRRNQFLVRELLALHPDRRVLVVEPPFDWLHAARRRGGRRRRGLRPVEADGRIVRFQPGKVLPRVLGPFADRSLERQVIRAARSLGFVEPTLWVNDPSYAGLARRTRWPTLYDMTDDWVRAGLTGRQRRRIVDAERWLFRHAGSVVVCSEELRRSRADARPDAVVVPNGVDAGHLRRPRARPADLPAGRCLVYLGTLHEDRLDVELVERLAVGLPDAAVVLLGPNALSASSDRRLRALANVHLLGARPYDEVPAYLQHADVVIVPHRVTPFTESLDPIKAYECLAVGRPTVATPVAGFRGLGHPVRIADRDRFVDAVRAVLDEDAASSPRSVPGWSERAVAFAAELDRARGRSAEQGPRVAFVDHCAKLSGGELALVRMLPALQELGVRAHVILGGHGPLEERIRRTGATVEVLALDERVGQTRRDQVGLRSVGLARACAVTRDTLRLRRRLRELQPDLVHTNSLKAALYGGLAGRLAGVPVVWHVRDRIAPDYLPGTAIALVRALARFVPDAVIVNSEATRRTLGPVGRSGVIPCPVVYDAAVESCRDRDGGDDEGRAFRVAIVGRLAPWKGQHVFLEAFAKAFPDGPEQAVVVGAALFGEHGYERELRALAAELAIAERVAFTGFVDDVAGVLARVDCLVHASTIPEPFGQVVVEGMAAGLPVVASAAGGPLEVITDGVDGLLVPPGDVDGLAERLIRLAGDPCLRRALGAAARQRAQDFSPEAVAASITDVYRSLLGR